MSILDDSALKQNTSSFNDEQIEAIKGSLDAMKLAAFFSLIPGITYVIILLKIKIQFTTGLMAFIMAIAYVVAGITTFMASRALTKFSYNPNSTDFEAATNSLKIAWFAWAAWAVVTGFNTIKDLVTSLF